ncbi:hypothetical protein [Aliarcobacter butzleri]|uniref:hypothetical protein n=1 Tax=Aliarcobacter butzleri TaxID=28197 RepID=UPI0021B276E5|nr:hypothetical protein [Aliarcobacter butzleri]MCT7605873.1 hypothetical protein [Aliarcobacter butzleri]MCT7608124.1 hypothetical protein [Aliarcobacter butzleri]
MKNYIMFEDGEIVLVKDFNKVFPLTMSKTDTLRVDICKFIVNKYYKLVINTLEWKILINLLSLRSKKIDIITSLVLISKTKKIKTISTDFIDVDFKQLFGYEIEILNKSFTCSFIDKSQFINAIIKFFINKLFRVLKKKKVSNNPCVVRTWTEHDIGLHKDVFYSSCVYIYPFGINLRRSFNFIKKCFEENSDVTLMGVPYSFNKLIKIFFSKDKIKDLLLLEYEIDAMKKHGKDFIKFETIYTSDEFLPAVPVLYNELVQQKKSVINIAHGMGMLNPYNIYTKFKVVNELQKKFYENFDQNIEYSVYREDSIKETHVNEKLETIIVFIHQNFYAYDFLYEESLQQIILSKLNNYNLKKVYIKLHPNIKKEEKDKIFLNYKNLKEIKTFDLNLNNYIFFAIQSSAYYDFRKYGQFFFIEDELFKPTNYFTNIKTININKLDDFMKNDME